MAQKEIKVPDLGDFESVPIIEILVKVGDIVKKNNLSSFSNQIKRRWKFHPRKKEKFYR